MSLLMLMMGAARQKQPVTKTYTSNVTFQMPAGVSLITVASGMGAAGTPASQRYVARRYKTTTMYTEFSNGTSYSTDQGTVIEYLPMQDNYCTPRSTTNGTTTYYCYAFQDISYYEPIAATTGASTTGFGQTFPGGYGGPASQVTFYNIPVTAGSYYALVIPSGGFITFTYMA